MRTIHHVLDIEAPAEPVWAALTERDGLSRWWSTQVAMAPAAVGEHIRFTFAGDFNPVMEITGITPGQRLTWRCVDGHQKWKDNTFVFEVAPMEPRRTRLRFTQEYAVELSDDDYGIYNFNWGYYLESLRLLATAGAGKPFGPPVSASPA